MSLHIENETVNLRPDSPIPPEALEQLRQRLTRSLDEHGVEGEARAKAMSELEELIASASGKTIDELSARSIASAMVAASESLDALTSGLTTLARAFDALGKGRQCFQTGEVRGLVSSAQTNLQLGAKLLEHMFECDCHKDEDDASKAETVPPPAPEAPTAEAP